MGKGTRSRINRSDEVIKADGAKKKSDSTKKTTIIVAVLVAVFVAILIAAIVFNNTGVLVRARIVAKSDNYKVTGTMASYFFNAQYQSFLNQLGSYASYFGLDTGKPLRSQKCTMYEGADTWWDYFMNGTKEQIKEILALCETAKAEGISLDDKDKENIDDAIKSKQMAELRHLSDSLRHYLDSMHDRNYNTIRQYPTFMQSRQLDTAHRNPDRQDFRAADYLRWDSPDASAQARSLALTYETDAGLSPTSTTARPGTRTLHRGRRWTSTVCSARRPRRSCLRTRSSG